MRPCVDCLIGSRRSSAKLGPGRLIPNGIPTSEANVTALMEIRRDNPAICQISDDDRRINKLAINSSNKLIFIPQLV